MRLDLYLKVSRLIKRRTIAQEMCERGKVLVNNQVAKPAKEVRPGDHLTLLFATKRIELEVLDLATSTRKADAALLYRVIAEQRIEPEETLWTKNPL